MKSSLTLTELAQRIEDNAKAKADYVADTAQLTMDDANDLAVNGQGTFEVNDWAHRQIGSRLNIPAKYYQRMLEKSPELLAQNVNHWLHSNSEKRLVRTMGGSVRAFLSDRYKAVENEDIAEAVLPVLADIPDVQIVSCAITETKLYIKAITPRIGGEVVEGDVVQAGLVFSNSEVGAGAIKVEPLVYRLVCLNGMIAEDGFRQRHLGGKLDAIEDVIQLQEDTRRADAKAIGLKCRDFAMAALDQDAFNKRLDRMRSTTERRIEGDPVKAVDVVSKSLNLQEGERSGVLRHLIEGGDLSQWGVLNAVTRTSQDVADYDRATDLEAAGGKILNLSQREWTEIAHAA